MLICSCCLRSRKQIHDLGLDGDVERGGRFVGDEDVRPTGKRHGDHRPLLHPAAQLVRVIPHPLARIDNADLLQPVRHFGVDVGHFRAMQPDRLGDLVADGEHRVERGGRLLEDVGDLDPRMARSSDWVIFNTSRPSKRISPPV